MPTESARNMWIWVQEIFPEHLAAAWPLLGRVVEVETMGKIRVLFQAPAAPETIGVREMKVRLDNEELVTRPFPVAAGDYLVGEYEAGGKLELSVRQQSKLGVWSDQLLLVWQCGAYLPPAKPEGTVREEAVPAAA